LQQTDAKKLVEVADAMKKIKDSMPEESSWFKRNFGGGTGQIPVGKVEPAKPEAKVEEKKSEIKPAPKVEEKKKEEGKPQIPGQIKKQEKEFGQGFIKDLTTHLHKEETGKASGDYGAAKDIGDGAGISFGAYQLTEKSGGIQSYLKKMADSGDKQAATMKDNFGKGGFQGDKAELAKYLKESGGTEGGKKAQDEIYKQKYLDPALKLAEKKGITDKGAIAQIVDHAVNAGVGGAERMINKSKGGSAEDMANARKTDYNDIMAKNPDKEKYRKNWMGRVDRNAERFKGYAGDKSELAMSKDDKTKDTAKAIINAKSDEEKKQAQKDLDLKFANIKAAEMKKADLSKMSAQERAKFESDLDTKLAKDKASETTAKGIDSAKEVAKSTIKINGKEKELGAGPSMDDLKKKADERQAVADKAEADAKPKTSQADIRKLDAQMEEKFKADAQIKPDGQTGIQRGSGFNKLGVNVGAENRRNPLNIGGMVNQAADAGAANLTQQKAFYEQQKKAGSESGEAMGPPPPHPELIAALQKMVTNGEKHIELQSVALEHASQMASTMDDNKRYTREIMKSSR
jgi:hypothetical protein